MYFCVVSLSVYLCMYAHFRSFKKDSLSFLLKQRIQRFAPSETETMRFDYANSVLFGCPQKHIARLQRAQHALDARVVTQQSSRSCSLTSTDLLRQLHWLPIEWRTKFKLASLTYKALHAGHPPYLAELLQYHKPARFTCSSASRLLSVPRHNLSFVPFLSQLQKYGIPYHLTFCSFKHCSFRCHLKTHYFQSAYPAP